MSHAWAKRSVQYMLTFIPLVCDVYLIFMIVVLMFEFGDLTDTRSFPLVRDHCF